MTESSPLIMELVDATVDTYNSYQGNCVEPKCTDGEKVQFSLIFASIIFKDIRTVVQQQTHYSLYYCAIIVTVMMRHIFTTMQSLVAVGQLRSSCLSSKLSLSASSLALGLV